MAKLWVTEFKGAGGTRSGAIGVNGLSIEIPGTQPVTLAVRALASTVTASGVLRMLEDW